MQTRDEHRTHGTYIRGRREALGLSQVELARAARVTPAMINRLESGNRRGRPPLLRLVAEALEVPASDLLQRAGYAAEAQYWHERDSVREARDPLAQCLNSLSGLPLSPAVRTALAALIQDLARDAEREQQRRFDRAVARVPDGSAQFAALRELIFDPAAVPSPERG
jgi:transcriptional regulator with XRE-family HTH domain